MKKYKVLIKDGFEYFSPYQYYSYGNLNDFLGIEMVCDNFDDNINHECSSGYYAIDINGFEYISLLKPEMVVFEMEMGGRSVFISKYKQRYEKQKFIREIPINELKTLIKEYSNTLDWDYYDFIFPTDIIKSNNKINNIDILNLKKVDDIITNDIIDLSKKTYKAFKKIELFNFYFSENLHKSLINCTNKNYSDIQYYDLSFLINSKLKKISYNIVLSINRTAEQRFIMNKLIFLSCIQNFNDLNNFNDEIFNCGKNPFKSINALIKKGLIPILDIDTMIWELYSIRTGNKIFEISREKLHQ